ncbi:DUF2064 domain-containing protein [Nocardioides panacisoli]|uniref:TIGR04282 family arsenosugar biosynthesis glycosyltransferase n=1 Tax=Nocardioides panacisoli TaxID=627624 RepID=UPI001C62ED1E|nr:DUF2064 domain-containing protein [Nocardioides panacisoli]QYJ05292.1 DUF2064 domain-containing protein [Nocardioides panacisoli]
MSARMLVIAKAPVPGRVKTRLGADVGMEVAAEVAAASLLDTLEACAEAVGPDHCHVALAGDLADAVRGDELRAALEGWHVTPQRGDGLGERLAAAHADVAGPRVQVGMDTPQVTAPLLRDVATGLDTHDAVLGRAVDGGWWVLALRDAAPARVLPHVPMSSEETHDATLAALRGEALTVGDTVELRDVDHVADADAVAADAPDSHFARCWSGVVVR